MAKSILDNLDSLIKKSNEKSSFHKAKNQLKKNLDFFKEKAPKLYQDYHDYDFNHLSLEFLDDESILLLNHNGEKVYEISPKEFCQHQVKQYFKEPLGFSHLPHEMRQSKFNEVKFYNQFYKNFPKAYKNQLSDPIGLFIINGVGLGYHIDLLINQLDIYHIAICESSHDLFFASLHSLNWPEIFAKFNQQGRSIHIDVGNSVQDNLSNIAYIFRQVGDFNRLNVFCYNHLTMDGDMTQQLSFQLMCNYQQTAIAHGFIEDERISLAHSVINLKNEIPIFFQSQDDNKDTPIFLIGNGPSLDKLIPFIKKNRDKALLVCCGSALHTLLNYDVLPDYLILMERGIAIYSIFKNLPKKIYEKTTLIGLNTLYPDIFPLFKKSFVALKSSDLGASFIASNVKESFPILPLPNPLVNNTALSITLALGFKTFFLLGIDLGMPDNKSHHAKKSEYYHSKIEEFAKAIPYEAKFQVKGNLSDAVFADESLVASAKAMADLINLHKNINVYNLNDGAFIENSLPITITEATALLNDFIDKTSIVEKLNTKAFKRPTINKPMDDKSIINSTITPCYDFLNTINLPKNLNDEKMVYLALNEVMIKLRANDKKNPWIKPMLFGSLSTFFTALLHACLISEKNNFKKNYHIALKIFNDFVDSIKNLLKNNPLQKDKKN